MGWQHRQPKTTYIHIPTAQPPIYHQPSHILRLIPTPLIELSWRPCAVKSSRLFSIVRPYAPYSDIPLIKSTQATHSEYFSCWVW